MPAPVLRTLLLIVATVAGGCAKDPEVAKREFLQSGDAYAAAGQHEEAVIEYRNALQQDPRFGAAQLKLAESYWAAGDRLSAAPAFVRAADLLPGDLDLQVRAGNMLLVSRRYEDAVGRADKALAVQPDHAGALVLRANGLAGMNRLEDALEAIEEALSVDPNHSGTYSTLGAVHLVRGDRQEAEAAFRRAVDVAPSSPQTHLALANFYLATGDQTATEAALRAALDLEPDHVVGNRALAYFYIGAGRPADAERYLRVAAEATPGGSGQLSLAEYYVAQGRMTDARRLFEQVALKEGRTASLAKLRLATLDFAGGKVSDAERRIDDILAADPSNTRALSARSEIEASKGAWTEALASARRAVESDRNSATAHYALGKVHVLRHEAADAASAFNTAIQLNPRLVPARVEAARLHLIAGRLDQAEQMVQSALAIAPQAPDARLTMARVLLAKNDISRAGPLLRDLDRTLPDSAPVATAVGLLEQALRQPAQARTAFMRALSIDPAALEPLRLLTQLDVREGRGADAQARLNVALAERSDNVDLLLLASSTAASLGDVDTADSLARSALDIDADALGAYALLGRLYLAGNRLAEATEEFRRLGERQPGSVAVHTTIGMLLQMQGQIDEARNAFERVIEIDAKAAVAANNLAWIYAEHGGNLDIALQLAQTAKAGLPSQPAVNDTLGWVQHKKGLSSIAIGPLEEAVAGEPRNALYHYHLGLAYAGAGDAARARAAFEEARQLQPDLPGLADALKGHGA